jgi:hypothetical protein
MANRAFLMLNFSGDVNEAFTSEAVAAGASSLYPVLWWSAFSPADLMLRTVEGEDEDGDPAQFSFPCPLTSLAVARAHAIARRPFFFSYFPETAAPIYQQWLALLDGIDAPFLSINTGDIWVMSEPEQSNAEIASYSRAFEDGQLEDWIALLRQVHIELDPATRQIIYRSLDRHRQELPELEAQIGYRLRGYGWERPVPWKD